MKDLNSAFVQTRSLQLSIHLNFPYILDRSKMLHSKSRYDETTVYMKTKTGFMIQIIAILLMETQTRGSWMESF